MSVLKDTQGQSDAKPSAAAASSYEEVASILAANESVGFGKLSVLADSVAVKSPGLANILQSSLIRTQVEIYTRLDAEAVAQQTRFMRELTTANICLMIIGILSGLALVAGKFGSPIASLSVGNVSLIIGGAILVLGACATMLTYKARDSGRVGRWLGSRGAAEMARIIAFQRTATEAAGKGHIVAGGALAFIRSCLLDHQRKWLETRAREHRSSAERTATWGAIAAALAFVAGSGAVIASFQPNQTWLALAGVVGAAIGSYATNREGLQRDHANADRYEKAVVALEALAGRFDAVAEEVFSGNTDALIAYTTAITDQLAAEHKQWLDGAAQAESVIAKLDEDLRRLGNSDSNTDSK